MTDEVCDIFQSISFYLQTRDRRTDGPTDGRTDGPTDGHALLQRCKDASKKNKNNDNNHDNNNYNNIVIVHRAMRIMELKARTLRTKKQACTQKKKKVLSLT